MLREKPTHIFIPNILLLLILYIKRDGGIFNNGLLSPYVSDYMRRPLNQMRENMLHFYTFDIVDFQDETILNSISGE
jgi:hypothetical protein